MRQHNDLHSKYPDYRYDANKPRVVLEGDLRGSEMRDAQGDKVRGCWVCTKWTFFWHPMQVFEALNKYASKDWEWVAERGLSPNTETEQQELSDFLTANDKE